METCFYSMPAEAAVAEETERLTAAFIRVIRGLSLSLYIYMHIYMYMCVCLCVCVCVCVYIYMSLALSLPYSLSPNPSLYPPPPSPSFEAPALPISSEIGTLFLKTTHRLYGRKCRRDVGGFLRIRKHIPGLDSGPKETERLTAAFIPA